MNKKVTIALVAAVAILFLGVASLGYWVLMRPAAAVAAPAEHKEEPETELAFLKLKNFVTDLADKDRARYVDVTIAIGVKDEVALEAVKSKEPQIRDIILSELRARTAGDLMGAAGKDKLAASLKEPLTKLLKENFKAVFITDLVVQ
ncbi:MAG TPA: flagellar basal body-associated FliL family protein [Symbiobacteriaceae bacterium]|nr:flagellar basal body-associated FliL family protein [Symbiobacteriaceae bacterium]